MKLLVIGHDKKWNPELKTSWSDLYQKQLFVFPVHEKYVQSFWLKKDEWSGGHMENNETFIGTTSSLVKLH